MAKLFGSDTTGFADRKQLAADETRFCILEALLKTQSDGRIKWYLTIIRGYDENSVVETLTFDRSDKRDRGFQKLKDEDKLPAHSVWLEKGEFRNRSTNMVQSYYDLNFDEDIVVCPCGEHKAPGEKTDGVVESLDTADIPF